MNDDAPSEGPSRLQLTPRKPAHVESSTRRTPADTARGISAILLLAAFVASVPVLLLLVSPVRSISLPSWSETVDSLTRPDDGHLFLGALAVVAWLAWLAFAVCVVVEAVAVVRGLPSPRLPLLGTPQRAAAALIAAAAVVLTVHPMPAVPVSARAVSATSVTNAPAPSVGRGMELRPLGPPNGASAATPAESVRARSPRAAVAAPRQAANHKSVTVRRGDTLWGLAEKHLGSGSRYQEIAKLNYGRVQSDGRALTDAHWIYPGWVLHLPTAAGGRQPSINELSVGKPPTAAEERSHTVRQGDTLWAIAERYLGDGQRYREIYELNAGRTQEVGGRLSDPDVILLGWVLLMPAPGPTVHAHPQEPQVGPTVPGVPPAPGATSADPLDDPPTRTPPHSVGEDERRGAVEIASSTDELDNSNFQLNRRVLGLTVLASAGLLGEVARRRRRQQRLRRPGERIQLPEGEVAVVEQTLRAAQDPVSLETLTNSLRALATNCRAAGMDLPRVLAARVSPNGLELLTDGEGVAVEPFALAGAGTWRFDRSTPATSLASSDQFDPYPALVTVGVAGDSVVMLNLEAAGTLTVVGEDHLANDVVRALALELATSPIAGRSLLVLTEALSELAEVSDVSRVHNSAAPEAARRAATHMASVAAILAESGVTDLHQARSRDVAADAWTPEVFVAGPPIAAAPWSGVAVITAGQDAGGGWTLKVDPGGRGRLVPLGIDLDVQLLSADDYFSVISLLSPANGGPESASLDSEGEHHGGSSTDPSSRDVKQAVMAALPPAPLTTSPDTGEQSEVVNTPRVLVLGRVELEGPLDGPSSNRRARATEFVTYLVLHPGGSAHEIDETIWPGRRVTKDARNSFVSRVRHWLGNAPDGQPYLPMVGDRGDYRLSPEVRCDWHDFLRMAREGLSGGPDGADVLEQALELVRGRPFLGIDPTTYCWAEADTQEMISSVVDVAHVLSVIRLDQGAARSARDAAARGLLVEPGSELLHCDAIRAAAMQGDSEEIARLTERLRAQIELIDPEAGLSEVTVALLSQVT